MEPVNPIYDIEKYDYKDYFATKRRVMHHNSLIAITTFKEITEIAYITV